MNIFNIDKEKKAKIKNYDRVALLNLLIEKYKLDLEVREHQIVGTERAFITSFLKQRTHQELLQIFDLLSYEAQDWVRQGNTSFKKNLQKSLIKLLRGNNMMKLNISYLYSVGIL